MTTVAVTGAGTDLGRRVATLLAADGTIVTGLDPDAADLKRGLEGADGVVHLAWAPGPRRRAGANPAILERFRRVLDAAADVDAVVLVTSAAVYGAWPDNPVPLSEEAALRPNPGVAFAAELAESERLAGEWAEAHPGAAVAVLRPTLTIGPRRWTWLGRVLAGLHGAAPSDPARPHQFIHVDDVATAVAHAVRLRLRGAYNVAPEGWIPQATAQALSGGPVRIHLPARIVRLAWRIGIGSTPPALLPYICEPWVVAADRLRATGWSAKLSHEEALVSVPSGFRWQELSPKRRQELALAGAALTIAGLVTGAVALVRRLSR